ncbi:hypothetical protein DPMN_087562 [Dreissena polymorpha]|uniref:Uncharacterized protein n=1 Tax=Dreissena polymorpha TaxID=45954 RepID=A0A9D4KSX2_DREPO|nr:hypothetical protein DPMN_087562 [Dreissena polymorpha]
MLPEARKKNRNTNTKCSYQASARYVLQVVDMRWGVLDEATDEQLGTELCLKELGLCQQLSTEPSFLVRTSGPGHRIAPNPVCFL